MAVIPSNTPTEDTEELEYATNELGLKAALIPSYVERHTGADIWYDTLGLNSAYDYDQTVADLVGSSVVSAVKKCVNSRIFTVNMGYQGNISQIN